MLSNKNKNIKKNKLIISQLRDNYSEEKNHIFFLNEGCKLHKTQKYYKYEKYNSTVIADYKNSSKNLDKDFSYLLKIYELLLDELSIKLNKIHKLDYKKTYWRIVIGPWLFEFISILFDNWSKIKHINKKYNIKYVKIASNNDKDLTFKNHNDFSFCSLTDEFNNQIYSDLIKYSKKLEPIFFKSINKKEKLAINKKNLFKEFINIFYLKILTSCNFFYKNSSKIVMFYDSYFSKIINFVLQVRLRQFPLFYRFSIEENNELNKNIRLEKLKHTNDNFVKIAKDLIFKYMPLSYLENFKNIRERVNNNSYIKEPRIIFTSSSFINDDYFSIFLAEKKKKLKIKFVSGQHGGNFYIDKLMFNEIHQKKISDKIITWGYKKEKIYQPLFNYKTANKKLKHDQNGSLLMVNYEISRFSGIHPGFRNFSYLRYLNDQFNFLKKLESQVSRKCVVRLYPYSYGWNTKDRFKEFKLDVIFDNNKSIENSLKKSRICYINLNSTVFLETLNYNFPTVIFFNLKQDLIRKDAMPYFNVLKKAQIFFDNEELAAAHINNVWNKVDEWWYSKLVQNSVSVFCNRYSRRCSKPFSSLFNFFSNLK